MRVLVFGGTTEGRELALALSTAGHDVMLSVATEFGMMAAESSGVRIVANRLNADEMKTLMKFESIDCVVDATHPYAADVSQNIIAACRSCGLEFLRLKRTESTESSHGINYVTDASTAAEMLSFSSQKALLTIGSKDLELFANQEGFDRRFFVRLLPMRESLEKAVSLGFRRSNIIMMQGPFSKEMNIATLKMTGASCLVTKESGDIGGFHAKVMAAKEMGCEIIVIRRPQDDRGITYAQVLDYFNISETIEEPQRDDGLAYECIAEETSFFPLFLDIAGKSVLMIGGGKVAERRVRALNPFGAAITVISPNTTPYIDQAVLSNALQLMKREYRDGDVSSINPCFVIAATNKREVNRRVMCEAAMLNIPVSVADSREECSMYFPALADCGDYVAGLISKSGDHAGVKHTIEKIRRVLLL